MPGWRPGAVTKIMFRKYRKAIKNHYPQIKTLKTEKQIKQMETISPFITISKVDGEFTVKVENMKEYNNNRLLHQYPYEKGPPVTYKIGRTDEENDKRQKKKEQIKRRSYRQQQKYLTQTFGNKCREICLKAYQQAIGIIPITNPNNPECPCFPEEPDVVSIMNSCFCSESDASLSSDEVDWTIEFTPPIAKYDPVEKKTRRSSREGSSQYDQLDIKLPSKLVRPKTFEIYSDLKSGENTVNNNNTKELQVDNNFTGAVKLCNSTKQPIISNMKNKQLVHQKSSANLSKLKKSPQTNPKQYDDHPNLILGKQHNVVNKLTNNSTNKHSNDYRSSATVDNIQKDKRTTKKNKLRSDKLTGNNHEKKESVLLGGGGAFYKPFARNADCCNLSTKAVNCLYNVPCTKRTNTCFCKNFAQTVECECESNLFNCKQQSNICDYKCN